MDTQSQKFISLNLSGEVETGAAGEQPIRNSLTDRNGHGGLTSPQFPLTIPRNDVLENPSEYMSVNFYSFCKPTSELICILSSFIIWDNIFVICVIIIFALKKRYDKSWNSRIGQAIIEGVKIYLSSSSRYVQDGSAVFKEFRYWEQRNM